MVISGLTINRLSDNLHTNRGRLYWHTFQSVITADGMEGGCSDYMGKRHRRSCARTLWLAAHSPVSRSLVEEHPSHGQVFVASKHRILSEIGGHHSRRWVLLLQKELMPFSLFICICALAPVDALCNLLYPRRRKFQMDFRSATTTAFYLRPHNSPRRVIWRFFC